MPNNSTALLPNSCGSMAVGPFQEPRVGPIHTSNNGPIDDGLISISLINWISSFCYNHVAAISNCALDKTNCGYNLFAAKTFCCSAADTNVDSFIFPIYLFLFSRYIYTHIYVCACIYILFCKNKNTFCMFFFDKQNLFHGKVISHQCFVMF